MVPLFSIIERHDNLDRKLLAGDARVFLSDWNGNHPFAGDYLGELATKPYCEWGSTTKYSEMQYDEELKGKIASYPTSSSRENGRSYSSPTHSGSPGGHCRKA